MPMAQAVRLCPPLLIVPANHRHYRAVSRQVMKVLHALTPLVEQISIDEAFLDVTSVVDANTSGESVARRLQAQIRRELGLPASLGVATNKLVAKIANNIGKAASLANGGRGDGPPSALMIVPPGGEADFLSPLPCDALWGVGPKTAERLASMGVTTIGELARVPTHELAARFGKNGAELAQRARGIDERPVITEHESKSVSQETTFTRDIADGSTLRATLRELAEGVGRDLRRKRLTATTVRIKIRWSDFTTPTRQAGLEQPSDDVEHIYSVALRLFERLWEQQGFRPVRLLGVGVSGLGEHPRQISLWDKPDPRAERLQAAMDALRRRFGAQALVRGSDLSRRSQEE
jgi:DNA polymerase-4